MVLKVLLFPFDPCFLMLPYLWHYQVHLEALLDPWVPTDPLDPMDLMDPMDPRDGVSESGEGEVAERAHIEG